MITPSIYAPGIRVVLRDPVPWATDVPIMTHGTCIDNSVVMTDLDGPCISVDFPHVHDLVVVPLMSLDFIAS
jgi:hypothetical protein